MLKRKAEQFPPTPKKRICTKYDHMAIDLEKNSKGIIEPNLMVDIIECEVNGKEVERFIPDFPMDDNSLPSLSSSMDCQIQRYNPAFTLEQARQRLCEAEFESQEHPNKAPQPATLLVNGERGK